MIDLLGDALTGGLLGLAGSMLQRGIGVWEMREKRADTRAARAHELRLLEIEMDRGSKESEHALEISDRQAESEAYTAAMAQQASLASSSYRWVNAVVSLVRPVLTLGAIGGAYVLAYRSGDLSAISTLDPAMVAAFVDTQMEQQAELTGMTITMSTGAFSWWFSDRTMARSRK